MLSSKSADQPSGDTPCITVGSGVATICDMKPRTDTSRARNSKKSSDQKDRDTQTVGVGSRRAATKELAKPTNSLSRAAKNSPGHNSYDVQCMVAGDGGATARSTVKSPVSVPRPAKNSADQSHHDTHPRVVGSGDEAISVCVQPSHALSPVSELCEQLVWLQKRRAYCIKRQSMADRSTDALIAGYLGFHTGMTEKERKDIYATAAKIRKAAEGGEDHISGDDLDRHVLSATSPIILASAGSREQFDDLRQKTEAKMRQLARQMPVWEFIAEVRGVAELGLAIVIGESGGDLSRFATVSKLWKRLGLAVIDGVRQGGLTKGASAEQWIQHGYSPRRRAEIWALFSDAMFRAQWRAEKDGVPAHPIGPYGEVYAREKAKALGKEWPKGRAHNHARRVMTKEFLKDLWIAWRAVTTELPQGQDKYTAVTLTGKDNA